MLSGLTRRLPWRRSGRTPTRARAVRAGIVAWILTLPAALHALRLVCHVPGLAHPRTWAFRGRVARARGRSGEAARCYTRAWSARPAEVLWLERAVLLHHVAGTLGAVLPALRQTAGGPDVPPEAAGWLARAHGLEGRTDAAAVAVHAGADPLTAAAQAALGLWEAGAPRLAADVLEDGLADRGGERP